jgi:2-dehydropantoate 2-reductase
MARIAIVGPGAIGGLVAAWLERSGAHEVVLCARTGFAELVVTTPEGELTSQPMVLTDPSDAEPVDWVLVATKAYDVEATAPWLTRLVGSETRVAVLQNGVEHVERFEGMVERTHILPVVVDIPAARLAPGRIVQHSLGSMDVPNTPDGAAFFALFEGCPIAVAAREEFRTRAWEKLCLNCAGALPALTQRATGPVWNPQIEAMLRGLVNECVAVARAAEGVEINPAVIDRVIEAARNAPDGSSNSMQADRLAGRPMEIEARNGVIVRLGVELGVPTPFNALFVTLLRASGSPWALN